jgi:molybdopterin-binding protein
VTEAPDLLTAHEVAALLHMHVKRVQLLARQGKLPTVRLGRRWLFPRDQILSAQQHAPRPSGGDDDESGGIDLSARNQLHGTVRSVKADGLMVEVSLRLAPQDIVAVITKASARRLGLAVGADAMAVIKATEVMIARRRR